MHVKQIHVLPGLADACPLTVHVDGDGREASYTLTLKRTSLHQCPRCRRRTSLVQEQLCQRCTDVVAKDATSSVRLKR